MEDSRFDVIIFGTGLTESILAAALSKAGFKVAHIDENSYYGEDEASLTLEELARWADENSGNDTNAKYHSITRSADIPTQSRQYSICLTPSVIPSIGPIISSLVSSGVAKYNGFRLVDNVCFFDSSGTARTVPGSKEDVFKIRDLSLVEKRRLMRFLTFAAGDLEGEELKDKHDVPFLDFLSTVFSLNNELSAIIAYSLAYCQSPTDPTLPALRRINRYLLSIGRYGPSPFLVGHYGGIGDTSQGFCRAAAVSGAVYILGRRMASITLSDQTVQDLSTSGSAEISLSKPRYTVILEDFPDPLSCNLIISSGSHVPSNLTQEIRQLPISSTFDNFPEFESVARCVAIVDQPIFIKSQDIRTTSSDGEGDAAHSNPQQPQSGVDTLLLIFPPGSMNDGSKSTAATVFITGEGSMSTPRGKWIIYISLPLTAEAITLAQNPGTLLQPYLEKVMSLSGSDKKKEPLYTTYYIQRLQRPHDTSSASSNYRDETAYLLPAPIHFCPLPDIADVATIHAEAAFHEAVKILRKSNQDVDKETITEGFWPPLEVEDDNDDQDW